MSTSNIIREREQEDEDLERYTKRPKLSPDSDANTTWETTESQHVLPPSHALLGIPLPTAREGGALNFLEANVGISEYIGRGEAKIEGIIKQRFTDFLVFEVDQDSNVIHMKSLECPEYVAAEEAAAASAATTTTNPTPAPVEEDTTAPVEDAPVPEKKEAEPWPAHFNTELSPYLSEQSIARLKEIYLEGRNPPRVSDSGWAGRKATTDADAAEGPSQPAEEPAAMDTSRSSTRGGRGRGGRRGGRGGRGGGASGREDTRKVLSEPMDSKEMRTAFHKVIKTLFEGKMDSQTDTSTPSDEGSRIVVKWAPRGGGGGEQGDEELVRSYCSPLLASEFTLRAATSRPSRGNFPPYIHFTMQKTNRDTQDALGHLSRLLHVQVKDLSVAGTKDKRGVTVQRVSLMRRNKTVEEVWKLANNIGPRRSLQDALSQRGERGVRIADLNYRKASLELGMLKGNAFVITLRNVKVESADVLDEAMNTMKTKGFINYYGMQRFGTASVPTHSIGLALLRSEWQRAADLILQKRPGEHPDVEAARHAWLEEKDLDKALNLFPRRLVAERCILESFKKQKGDTRNVMGALSTIPRNLRLMYIHAYQSYVWNAIVSERLREYPNDRPIAGDIVLETGTPDADRMDVDGEEAENQDEDSRRSRKPYKEPKVRTLTEADLDKYTIFDVVMPLPGTSVAYPGGKLGETYREFLKMDGLDPDNFVRKQKDYTLNGSYRAMLHLPKEVSWKVMRYTDPDVPLAQADEDKLLGFDPPVEDTNGKFMAVQVCLRLGTAAYATMALREITKTDTSSHVQSGLTLAAEDQKHRGEGAEVEGVDSSMEPTGEE